MCKGKIKQQLTKFFGNTALIILAMIIITSDEKKYVVNDISKQSIFKKNSSSFLLHLPKEEGINASFTDAQININRDIYNNSLDIIINDEIKLYEITEQRLKKMNKYYSIEQIPVAHVGKNLLGQYDYKLTLCNAIGTIIYEEIFEVKPPWVTAVSDDVLEIGLNIGNPGPKYVFYYDTNESLISESYPWSALCKDYNDNLLIYNMDISKDKSELKLILRDIFNKDLYYKEIKKDFHKMPINSQWAIYSLKFIDNQTIVLDYLSEKANIDNWEHKIETINLIE